MILCYRCQSSTYLAVAFWWRKTVKMLANVNLTSTIRAWMILRYFVFAQIIKRPWNSYYSSISTFLYYIFTAISLHSHYISSNPEFTLRTLAILYIVINNKKSFLKKWCIVNRLHLIFWHLDRLSGNNNMQAHTPYFKFPKIGLIKYPLNKQIVLRGILSNA